MSDEAQEKRGPGRQRKQSTKVGVHQWMTVSREERENGVYEHVKCMWLSHTPPDDPHQSWQTVNRLLLVTEIGKDDVPIHVAQCVVEGAVYIPETETSKRKLLSPGQYTDVPVIFQLFQQLG